MQTVAATEIYRVPYNKVAYITAVVIRDPSASMAGGDDYDILQWRQTVDLSSLTTLNTDYIVLDGEDTKYQEIAASTSVTITVVSGTSASCTATIDVFGYLV
jgi:hypothetical protein